MKEHHAGSKKERWTGEVCNCQPCLNLNACIACLNLNTCIACLNIICPSGKQWDSQTMHIKKHSTMVAMQGSPVHPDEWPGWADEYVGRTSPNRLRWQKGKRRWETGRRGTCAHAWTVGRTLYITHQYCCYCKVAWWTLCQYMSYVQLACLSSCFHWFLYAEVYPKRHAVISIHACMIWVWLLTFYSTYNLCTA